MEPSFARSVWRVLETVHAVTYFAPESLEANRALGLRGYWMGYFAGRSAPLGEASPAVVSAAFFNFRPSMVRRALPDAWSYASPAAVLDARTAAASAALRRIAPAAGAVAAEALTLLRPVVEAADGGGRPLFGANRDLPEPSDPVGALWQAATTLREHRGDGHVALLVAEGLDGCEAHVLFAAAEGVPVEVLRDNRGWSPQEWKAAADRLASRGLLTGTGEPTSAGRALRERVESRTDELALVPYRVLGDGECLLDLVARPAREVARSGQIPFPNPMGLRPPN
ncbi:SCO6745 family protein [Wenjunlia tyrosinilytica]|uniref:SalK n=1 Tax=Wenjunlia tyrosinilytica TaxID=1544741 RepID=A0A917ZNV1_9ACTN|nr:hypothetical protein [Wenjunlia tyrosinilytica]GGO87655.1 hypothetical protein GCM10012280_26610 [Wenjunlia tyrosinilytica]